MLNTIYVDLYFILNFYKQTYYRIANCITTDEQVSCETIIKEFFYLVNNHYQNERQLEEWLYITKGNSELYF